MRFRGVRPAVGLRRPRPAVGLRRSRKKCSEKRRFAKRWYCHRSYVHDRTSGTLHWGTLHWEPCTREPCTGEPCSESGTLEPKHGGCVDYKLIADPSEEGRFCKKVVTAILTWHFAELRCCRNVVFTKSPSRRCGLQKCALQFV